MSLKAPIDHSAELTYTFGNSGYDEIISLAKPNSIVTIVSYNLSLNKSKLLNRLYRLDETINLTIITNIPGRFDTYKPGEKKDSSLYWAALNPNNFRCKVKVLFCLRNHAKIVAVDDNMYIGSQNFSDFSYNNHECGIIVKDSIPTRQWLNRVLFEIKGDSEAYEGHEQQRFIISLERVASILETYKAAIRSCFIEYNDAQGQYAYRVDASMLSLTKVDFETLADTIHEAEDLVNEMSNTDSFEHIFERLHSPLQELNDEVEMFLEHPFTSHNSDDFFLRQIVVDGGDELDSIINSLIPAESDKKTELEFSIEPRIALLSLKLRKIVILMRSVAAEVRSLPVK